MCAYAAVPKEWVGGRWLPQARGRAEAEEAPEEGGGGVDGRERMDLTLLTSNQSMSASPP